MVTHSPNQPFPVSLRVRVAARDQEVLPAEQEALAHALFERLEQSMEKGKPQPACVAFSDDLVTQYDLAPLVRGGGDLHRFIASVAGSGEADTVGVIGLLRPKKQLPSLAVVFLEESDGRWWHLWSAVDEMDGVFLGHPRWACAEEGAPRPAGLGGWWTRSRMQGLSLQVSGTNTTVH